MVPEPYAKGAALAAAVMIVVGCAANSPMPVDVIDGRLAPCPDKPNCVASQAEDPRHRIAPLVYTGELATAMRILAEVVAAMPGARIVNRTDRIIYAEYRTRWMGFIDDIVFYFPDAPVIHVRSASRAGYYDFGVNRKRVERIRKQFRARLDREGSG